MGEIDPDSRYNDKPTGKRRIWLLKASRNEIWGCVLLGKSGGNLREKASALYNGET
jgi:hypothetical protein